MSHAKVSALFSVTQRSHRRVSAPYAVPQLLQNDDPGVLALQPLHEVAALAHDVRDRHHAEQRQDGDDQLQGTSASAAKPM